MLERCNRRIRPLPTDRPIKVMETTRPELQLSRNITKINTRIKLKRVMVEKTKDKMKNNNKWNNEKMKSRNRS